MVHISYCRLLSYPKALARPVSHSVYAVALQILVLAMICVIGEGGGVSGAKLKIDIQESLMRAPVSRRVAWNQHLYL